MAGAPSISVAGFALWQHGPFLVAAVSQLALGARRRESWRLLLGSLIAIAPLALTGHPDTLTLRMLAASQLTLLAMLIIGACFDDDFSHALRLAGAGLALFICMMALFLPIKVPAELPAWVVRGYPLGMALLLAVYGMALRSFPIPVLAALIFAGWVVASGWHVYSYCRQLIAGLDYIVLSLMLFVLAISISLGKSGILSRWIATWRVQKAQSLE